MRPAGLGESCPGRAGGKSLWCRDESTGWGCNQGAASHQRHYANGARQDGGEARVRMVMEVIADGRHVTRPTSIDCWFIVDVIVTVLVAVMPEMCSMARSVFQRIANTHRCRVGGVQREHDGKKNSEAGAHS
ncbi:MAG: hypothetical protein Q7T21_10690 [Gallionella sp.]|nr:hypothetical protein [Gallionella sp.]